MQYNVKKYMIDTEENKVFLREIRENLLNFGHRFPSPWGSSYYLGDDGTPWKDYKRETWITCRMAHVYSIGTLLGYEGSGELVDDALRGLKGELHDSVNGGWYPGITADGAILPDKQCYAHAFVILAASSAMLAKREGAEELLEEALELFECRFWDDKEGLAVDTWNTEFSVLNDYRGLNANMHTVEAFLAVADATGREMYRSRAGRIIEHVISWAAGNKWRIPEHFTKEWKADGAAGIVYTTDWEGKPVIHDRMHWTLAEAINTSAVLYHVTKNERYRSDYGNFMEYLDRQVLDHVNGSWFHQMNEKGEVTGSVWPGKSDIYHALQATLIPYCKPEISVASAIRK